MASLLDNTILTYQQYLGTNNQRSMIRRKRITTRDEHTQQGEQEELIKESQQRRKESTGKVHRFNYGINSMQDDEGMYHSQSRARRQEYRITSCENQPSLDTKPPQHQPSRLLKKDYLYERSTERQECRHALANMNMNTSFELNGPSYGLAEREEFKNSRYEHILHSKKHSFSDENNILSYNHSKRVPNLADFPKGYLANSQQYPQKRADFQHTKTEEELQAKYQEIYANNQKQKLKISHHHRTASQIPSINPNKENIVINTRLINRRNTTAREQSQSIGRKELSSGSNTQRLQSSSKKTNLLRAIQTRKTSPNRLEQCRVKQVSEMKTLRSSPVRNSPLKLHIDSSLKLIDDFSLRISSKIEELTFTLHSLRLIK